MLLWTIGVSRHPAGWRCTVTNGSKTLQTRFWHVRTLALAEAETLMDDADHPRRPDELFPVAMNGPILREPK